MALTKLWIIAYSLKELCMVSVREMIDTFEVQINPETIKWKKNINYSDSKTMGKPQNKKYNQQDADTLSFDIDMDDTGIVPGEESITDRIESLESLFYDINSETHEPNYAQIVWGTTAFFGRLSSLDYNYSLFRPDGSPLRVKISLAFEGYKDAIEVHSPDLSRVIVLKDGESIPLLCEKHYGDPSYCQDIARINNLVTFRNVKPGTRLLFPPLVRHGRISQ